MSFYMVIENIDGGVTTKGFERSIALDSVDFALSRNISARVGDVNDREGGVPKIGEFIVTKVVDESSPYLLEASCEGGSLGKIKLDVCGASDQANKYLQYALHDVVISHYDIHGVAEDEAQEKPTETLYLNFSKIEMKYIPRDSSNKPKNPVSAGYDLEKATKM